MSDRKTPSVVSSAPPHHKDCKTIHYTWRWPCFPTSKDAFTLQQKAWLQANKENLPPPHHRLLSEVAFNHKYEASTIQDARHAQEDIECDESEEE